jgi:hypothetical protein
MMYLSNLNTMKCVELELVGGGGVAFFYAERREVVEL